MKLQFKMDISDQQAENIQYYPFSLSTVLSCQSGISMTNFLTKQHTNLQLQQRLHCNKHIQNERHQQLKLCLKFYIKSESEREGG